MEAIGLDSQPTLQRTPRQSVPVPIGSQEIPAPPPYPTKPGISLVTLLVPLFSTLAGISILLTAQTSPAAWGIAISLMLAAYFVTILYHWARQGAFGYAIRTQEEKYRAQLQAMRAEFSTLRVQQIVAARQNDPTLDECLRRAEQLDHRLWERTPRDSDFLAPRLGLGTQPFAIAVKPPQTNALAPDSLTQAAQTLSNEFNVIPDLPVQLPLREIGTIGLHGSRAAALNLTRTLITQLVTHHAPNEVKIAALFSERERADWDWLRWLPHTWNDERTRRWLACEPDAIRNQLANLYYALNRRAISPELNLPLPFYILIVGITEHFENEPLWNLLHKQGPALGVFTIFIADRREDLPNDCRALIQAHDGQANLTAARDALAIPFTPDKASVELADQLARTLACIRWQNPATSIESSKSITLFELFNAQTVRGLNALSRWRENNPTRPLAIPFGQRVNGEILSLDLAHTIVAGAVGSGHRELAQTILGAFSCQFHPHQIAFASIDFQSGGITDALKGLPHLISTLTNLRGNHSARALAGLQSELQQRQTLLSQANVKDVDAYQQLYQQGQATTPIPHLLVVVDKCAELKGTELEFVRDLIHRVTRADSSLGIHLLLVAQTPLAMDAALFENVSSRLCLRVDKPEHGTEILGHTDAAYLVGAGRGYFQIGHDAPLELFQAARSNTAHTPTDEDELSEIKTVALDGTRQPIEQAAPPSPAITQLQALVKHLQDLAIEEGIQPPAGPWLAPLKTEIYLNDVRPPEGWTGRNWSTPSSWLAPAIGIFDNPIQRQQDVMRLDLVRDGNLTIYGADSAGKTTLLQTLVTALALTHSPNDVHFYLLDFGRQLSLFETLPHVGAVIASGEEERLKRLWQFLAREVKARQTTFTHAGVKTLADYRRVTDEPMPALVVIVDNYANMPRAYPNAEDEFISLAHDGNQLGIHLVLTANHPDDIPIQDANYFPSVIKLHLAESTDDLIRGRGIIQDTPAREFQTALPAEGATETERNDALNTLFTKMARSWLGVRAQPIQALPAEVMLADLIELHNAMPRALGALTAPLGMQVDDLETLSVDLNAGPHFIITGAAKSGKTTLLQTWLTALTQLYPPQRGQLYLVDFQRAALRPFAYFPHTMIYIEDEEQLAPVLAEISGRLTQRAEELAQARQANADDFDSRIWLAGQPAIVLAVDDFSARQNCWRALSSELLQLVQQPQEMGFHFLLAGNASEFNLSEDSWFQMLKDGQPSFGLGTNDAQQIEWLKTPLPSSNPAKVLPPGQGYFMQRRQSILFKAAVSRHAHWKHKTESRFL